MRNVPLINIFGPTIVKMRCSLLLAAGILAPITGLAAPGSNLYDDVLYKRENLCSLKAPPALCQPNATITVEETALRAYQFYRAFVVDGDPRVMFSLIDSTYKVSHYFSSVSPFSGFTTGWVLNFENLIATPRRLRGRPE
jgi:hypothetical protein